VIFWIRVSKQWHPSVLVSKFVAFDGFRSPSRFNRLDANEKALEVKRFQNRDTRETQSLAALVAKTQGAAFDDTAKMGHQN
jgi:hypothetical protein